MTDCIHSTPECQIHRIVGPCEHACTDRQRRVMVRPALPVGYFVVHAWNGKRYVQRGDSKADAELFAEALRGSDAD